MDNLTASNSATREQVNTAETRAKNLAIQIEETHATLAKLQDESHQAWIDYEKVLYEYALSCGIPADRVSTWYWEKPRT